MTEIHTKSGAEIMERRFDKMLLGVIAVAFFSCCATTGILLANQEDISKIFLSLAGGN